MRRNSLVLLFLLIGLNPLAYSYVIAFHNGVYYDQATTFPFGYTVSDAPDASDSANDFEILGGNCTISATANVNSISITSGTSLTISNSITFTCSNTLNTASSTTVTVNSGGTLNVGGDISNSGTIVVQDGGNLIQTGSGFASGSYQVSQSGSGNANNYNFWSSPINGASLPSVFSGANECDFYYYNAAGAEFRRLSAYSTCVPAVTADGSSTMGNGVGYSVAGGGSPTFSGTINTGTITNNTVSSGWNLVGNPYPSSLSGSSFLTTNTNTTGTLYFWSDDGTAGTSYDGSADYATWNTGGGTGATGGGSSTIPNGSIPVGQGFFVSVTSGSSITFNNGMRGGSNSQFFKSDQEVIPRLWVSAEQKGFANSQILIAFSENASDGVDWSYDSERYAPTDDFVFGSILVGQTMPYAIQSFSKDVLENATKNIPISIVSKKQGITTFQIDGVENWDSSLVISIKDNVTGKVQNLAHGPFSTFLNANEKYDSRFTLLINNPNGPPTSVNDLDPSKLKLYFNEGNLTIANTVKMKTIDIYSISGVKVNSHSLNESTYSQISLNELPTGIYIGSVTLENGNTISKRFAIQ